MVIDDYRSPLWLLDAIIPNKRRAIKRGLPVFSSDEKMLAIVIPHNTSMPLASSVMLPQTQSALRVYIRDLQTGRERQLQSVPLALNSRPTFFIQDAAFSMDNATFAVLAVGTTVFRWDVQSGNLLTKTKGQFDYNLGQTRLFDESEKIWKGSASGVTIYNARTGKVERTLKQNGVLMRDENFYWSLDPSMKMETRIYRVSDGAIVFHYKPATAPVVSPDGRWILVPRSSPFSTPIKVELREVGTWHLIATRELTGGDRWEFDGPNHVLTLNNKGQVYRWRLR